jgi:hypothetical protein
MNNTRTTPRRAILSLLLTIAMCAAPRAFCAEDFGPTPELLAALNAWQSELARIATIDSDFVQEKRLALFQEPLAIRGRLCIATNGNFAWETHSPMRYKMVVSEGRVRQWDEETDRVQTISMKDNPAAAAIHTQMTTWFSGRYAALTNDYVITLASPKPVSFLFVPRTNSPAATYLASVQIWLRSDGQYLERIRIGERAGDSAQITFTNPLVNLPLPPDAWNPRRLTGTNTPANAGSHTPQ